MKYKKFDIFEFSESLMKKNGLKEVETDSIHWRTFYTSNDSHWILFYPFSEYHGGGQSYIIRIGKLDFESWISDNIEFEKEIRLMLENN